MRRGAEQLHNAIVDIRRIPYPVIAAINGPAAGAGMSLALSADIRIASEDAFLAIAYGRIGAAPDGGMTYFLPRVVGPAKALELALNDPNLDANAALEAGLVSEVVPADQLLTRAREKAEKLAAKAPYYVRMTKRLLHESIENSINDHLQLERHGIADSMGTQDLRRGVTAFFAGEQPEFHGRLTNPSSRAGRIRVRLTCNGRQKGEPDETSFNGADGGCTGRGRPGRVRQQQ